LSSPTTAASAAAAVTPTSTHLLGGAKRGREEMSGGDNLLENWLMHNTGKRSPHEPSPSPRASLVSPPRSVLAALNMK